MVLLGFARIGLTAFGGGSATTLAMRRMVLRRRWLSEDEFLDTLVLSRLCPGITILAQAILIGRRAAGIKGLFAALVGLMVPSVTITLGLARLYQWTATSAAATAPLRALSAVAAGFALALAVQTGRDSLRRSHLPRGLVAAVLFFAIAIIWRNPLIVMGGALLAGICLPRFFSAHDDADS